MDFGLHLGTRGIAATPQGLTALAQRADALGFGHLGFSDHIVIARQVDSRYPYNESGDWPAVDTGTCLDQLGCMLFAGALTKNIRLLSSVMVLPHRPPLQAAKLIATADTLTGGRVTIGVGIGWMAEELALLGSPPFERRGKASDEYIQAFRRLWRDPEPAMDGEFVKFDGLFFEPKPPQAGGPPIWVGGEGGPARRRAGRLGDAWYPTIRNPKIPLDSAERFAAGFAEVRAQAEAAGRDPSTLDAAIFAPGYSLGAVSGARMSFTGTAEQIAGDARAFAAAGVKHIVIGFESNDLAESLDRLERFAAEVMPLVP